MCWLVVIQHQVYGVGRRYNEDDLENSVVETCGFVKGPEQVEVPSYVDSEVEKLRFKRYAGCALV